MAYNNTTLRTKAKVLTLEELHLDIEVSAGINQLIEEFTYLNALKDFNIPVDNKILLHGHTGCGKTATANAIGLALHKSVIVLNLGGFVSSRLGETGKNLSEVFRKASNEDAILFIDEFDFIGKIRDYDNKDSGEMKRLVNTLIQQIDNLADNSILICATNHLDIIDTALLRRFQLKLKYELPTEERLNVYYDSLLADFPENINKIKRNYNISYAEAKDLVFQQIKSNIIQLEKQKKHLLFSYGSLKLENVQLSIFRRKLKRTIDELSGYRLSISDLKNSVAISSKDENDAIEGVVFEVTGEELVKADRYEGSNCKRVLETTKSGLKAWVYVLK